FFPMGPLQVVSDFTRDPRVEEHRGDIVRPRFGPALILAEDNLPMVDMLDYSRRDSVQADETKAAHDLLRWEELGQLGLVPQPILQREQNSGRVKQVG